MVPEAIADKRFRAIPGPCRAIGQSLHELWDLGRVTFDCLEDGSGARVAKGGFFDCRATPRPQSAALEAAGGRTFFSGTEANHGTLSGEKELSPLEQSGWLVTVPLRWVGLGPPGTEGASTQY